MTAFLEQTSESGERHLLNYAGPDKKSKPLNGPLLCRSSNLKSSVWPWGLVPWASHAVALAFFISFDREGSDGTDRFPCDTRPRLNWCVAPSPWSWMSMRRKSGSSAPRTLSEHSLPVRQRCNSPPRDSSMHHLAVRTRPPCPQRCAGARQGQSAGSCQAGCRGVDRQDRARSQRCAA